MFELRLTSKLLRMMVYKNLQRLERFVAPSDLVINRSISNNAFYSGRAQTSPHSSYAKDDSCPGYLDASSIARPDADIASASFSADTSSLFSAEASHVTETTPSLFSRSTQSFERHEYDPNSKGRELPRRATAISEYAVSILVPWSFNHEYQLPSDNVLAALEVVTDTPRTMLLQWLRQHSLGAANVEDVSFSASSRRSAMKEPYRVRCRESNSRHRVQRIVLGERTLYECTNGCSQRFSRKGE